MTHDDLLDAYAKLTIRSGLNIQKGQQLVISAPLDAAPLARRVTEHAYKAGATMVTTLFSDRHAIVECISRADLVIGAVLIPGARTPMLIRRDDLAKMLPRAVIIDVAIDQGGCIETSRPTTHANPTYIVDDVVHYCVTNMPGAVGRTSTYALTNVTLPYVLQLANKGVDQACKDNPGLAQGVNVRRGKITNAAVAETFGLECHAV